MTNEHCLVFQVTEAQLEELQESFSFEYFGTNSLKREIFAFCTYIAFSSPRKKVIIAKISEISRKICHDNDAYTFRLGSLCKTPPYELIKTINTEETKYLETKFHTEEFKKVEFTHHPENILERFDLERAACGVAKKYGVERAQVSIIIHSNHVK